MINFFATGEYFKEHPKLKHNPPRLASPVYNDLKKLKEHMILG